jgi:hypothetical protein
MGSGELVAVFIAGGKYCDPHAYLSLTPERFEAFKRRLKARGYELQPESKYVDYSVYTSARMATMLIGDFGAG